MRGAAAKVLGRTPGSEGVRAGDFVNKVGRAVCELRFANPERITADRGFTHRDLSIGTLWNHANMPAQSQPNGYNLVNQDTGPAYIQMHFPVHVAREPLDRLIST